MTAQRWWVRLFARWQARVDSVKGQIQAVSLAVTAFSTFSLVLQNAGLSEFIVPLGLCLLVAGPGYAYLFFEGGVWNQVSRDRSDMSGNFAAPGTRINAELICRGLAPLLVDGEFSEEQRQRVIEELNAAFEDQRDGIELPDD
jgi:hypothetical protein